MSDLFFIVPLRNPTAAIDWNRVSSLCCQTLQSTLSQSTPGSRTILVCSQPPIGLNKHEKLEIISESFPDPTSKENQLADKYEKLKRGLISAYQQRARYVMFVDADDLVSNRIADFVTRQTIPTHPGWLISKGYFHRQGSKILYLHRNFHQFCGTSAILRVNNNELPRSMDSQKSTIPLLAHGHHQIASYFEKIGQPLSKLPFPGAIYLTETGENWSGFSWKNVKSRRLLFDRLLFSRALTTAKRTEFGLRGI